jgi:hypothetical protein
MPYQINTPNEPYTFEASSFLAACVVTSLLGGGFYSLWQGGKKIMPIFMFGGHDEWYQRAFGMNFSDAVQEVSKDEVAQIYLTVLAGKPEERKRYLEELSLIHHSKAPLLSMPQKLHVQCAPTPYGSFSVPGGGDVVTLIDGRTLPVQEILGEIGTNLWLVDLGEIPSYAVVPGDVEGRWDEAETAVT